MSGSEAWHLGGLGTETVSSVPNETADEREGEGGTYQRVLGLAGLVADGVLRGVGTGAC